MGEDDDALWRKITDGIRPLKGRESRRHPAQERPKSGSKSKSKTNKAEETHQPRRVIQPGPPPKPLPKRAPPPLQHGQISGVDRRNAERLKRGKLPIDGRIDLHGLTQVEAQRALIAFLEASQVSGRRCVLIITGKGGLKGAQGGREVGVLRQKVPQWLNLPGLREKVLAYDYAQPRDGGQGALYVLLRRLKAGS